eukprot:m.640131 g.640131  ORF g.640131 m.640131 type:complete len:115 (-) comp58337_c0_seq9:1546-1890(-)
MQSFMCDAADFLRSSIISFSVSELLWLVVQKIDDLSGVLSRGLQQRGLFVVCAHSRLCVRTKIGKVFLVGLKQESHVMVSSGHGHIFGSSSVLIRRFNAIKEVYESTKPLLSKY